MKNFLYSIILIFGIVIMSCAKKEVPMPEEQLLRISYTSRTDNTERDYFLYLPKGYDQNSDKKWPVLMFLHGDGERGNGKDELDYTLIHGPLYEAWIRKRDLPFIMIVPQMHMFGRDTLGLSYIDNRNIDWIPKRQVKGIPKRPNIFSSDQPMLGAIAADTIPGSILTDAGWDNQEEDLLAMIDKTIKDYNADVNRVYLSGLSYGGAGTWYIASKNPERFAAISPIVGWGHPDLMDSIANHKIPVWAFAGGRDNTVQAQYFFAGINKLEDLGNKNVRFTIHEDMGHDTWRRVYGGEDIYNWFLEFSKE
jgi:predicted peptidase